MHSLSLLVLVVAWSGAQAGGVVDYQYVLRATTDPDVLIIDVRSPAEVSDLGSIPSSINIPLNDVHAALGAMPAARFLAQYGRPKPARDAELIVYCTVGIRAARAQQAAANLGYTNVKNYRGSYTDWVKQQQQ
ncbi:hypothetical protein JYU34_013191 [Plutella xylostella]|uniref:Rhodanese domain-containing protein n=1 Tax=Plutella xylostella TaxID=51655 RepID=A0ABQ7QD68_PLUXY|nr:hypothetical protein JYU34_013191 [Plutella xylostella]